MPFTLGVLRGAWGWALFGVVWGLVSVVCGGLSYTAGVLFFAIGSKLRYGHLIWHFFVLAGTACHYFAVLWYAA